MGDRLDLLIPLNQDTMDRHLGLLGSGAACLYNADHDQTRHSRRRRPALSHPCLQTCRHHAKQGRAKHTCHGRRPEHDGRRLSALSRASLPSSSEKKSETVIDENISVARAGYDYATANFKPFAWPLPMTENKYAVLSGNSALAMGGAAAGVKFYCAYPMSPSTGVLHWMADHARKAGIVVRQVEDEIGVINMAIGAAHAGVRAMCATSGGGFALMSEGLGLSARPKSPSSSSTASAPARPPESPPKPSRATSGRCWAPPSATIRE